LFTINTGVSFNKKVDFGIEYNFFSGLGGQIILNAQKNISFGYAYITATNNEINQFSSGTHEALLKIKIARIKPKIIDEQPTQVTLITKELRRTTKTADK